MGQFLVVEEDRRQFVQIKECLQSKGHKAWQAATPEEAFDFLSQYNFDVIIAALNVESSDVFEFLREVKAADRSKEITFVFYCTDQERCDRYATAANVDAGKALGARKFILLPEFDANRFWEHLEECVPQNAQKNDSLGGEVKTYSINEFAWTTPPTRQKRA